MVQKEIKRVKITKYKMIVVRTPFMIIIHVL